jgi:hypothetical protein
MAMNCLFCNQECRDKKIKLGKYQTVSDNTTCTRVSSIDVDQFMCIDESVSSSSETDNVCHHSCKVAQGNGTPPEEHGAHELSHSLHAVCRQREASQEDCTTHGRR